MLSYLGTWHLTTGYAPGRTTHSAHPSLVPFQAFQTSDGWIVVACAKEKFFGRLALAIERPDLAADPRFVDFASRGRHREVLLAELEPVFVTRSTAQWATILSDAGVPSGPVQSVQDALVDPHTVARGSVVSVDHPHWGAVHQVASPLRLPGGAAPSRAPRRGENAGEILSQLLGYSAQAVESLTRSGAFGDAVADPLAPANLPDPEAAAR
jgi:crotonobetainyl-CoA:carnitine CoA-transferase CaiB-like acyl-CoA transferase